MEEITTTEKDSSFKDIISIIKDWIKYFLSKVVYLGIMAFVGILIGYIYYKTTPAKYTAECTFILDESSRENTGNSSALAVLGIGGNSNSEGLYSSSNLIWFYSSRLMLKRTLLTEVKRNSKNILLIDWLLQNEELGDDLAELSKSGNIKFVSWQQEQIDSLSIPQNKVLENCIGYIRNNVLKVAEAPKTENMITISVTSKDELFSKEFTNAIVKNVNDYYVDNKTKRNKEEVANLENKLKSISAKLGSSMFQAASNVDAIPNANPAQQILKVEPQRKGIDVQVNSVLYIELVKNLEAAKLSLIKQTPIIQIIDGPVLPLPISKWGLAKCILIGAGVMFILGVIFFAGRRLYSLL